MTIVLRDQLSPGLAALAITYIMMIGDSTRLDHDDHDLYIIGLSEIGAEGQKVQKTKLVTFFLL